MKPLMMKLLIPVTIPVASLFIQGCYTQLATVHEEEEPQVAAEDSTRSGNDYDSYHRWRDSYHVGFDFYYPAWSAYWFYDPWWYSPAYYDPWWCGSPVAYWRYPYPYYGYYPRFAYFAYPHYYYSYPYYYPGFVARATYATRNSGVRRSGSGDRSGYWSGRGTAAGGVGYSGTTYGGVRTAGMSRPGSSASGQVGSSPTRGYSAGRDASTPTRVGAPAGRTRGYSGPGTYSGRSGAGERRYGTSRPGGSPSSGPRVSAPPSRSGGAPSVGARSSGSGGGRSGGGGGRRGR